MTAEKHRIRLALADDQLAQEFRAASKTAGGYEILPPGDPRRPDLLILELGKDFRKDLEGVRTLMAAGEVGEVFLTAAATDPEVLLEAMRLGAREFFPQPVNPADITQALVRFKQRCRLSGACSEGQLISVFGSKGGVGTTTVAVNLAVTLARRHGENTVALLDMNTLFGEIPLFLEIHPKFHWGEITRNIDRLDDTFLRNILSTHASGVHVLPSPAHLNGHHRPTPAIMERLLGLMRTLYSYVIVDTGQSTDENSLQVLQMSDTVLLVSILSLPCLSNTNRLLKSFTDLGYVSDEKIRVVVNRYARKSEISLKDAAVAVNRKIFWVLPNDYPTTMSAINQGKPLSQIAPRSEISRSFEEMAETLAPREAPAEKKKWRFLGLGKG